MEKQLKALRKKLGLTQEEFATRLGIKRTAISNYEIGRNEPIDAVISLICREFNVNETWLRTGEGEMFVQRSNEDDLAAAAERLLSGESSEFKRRLVNALSTLKDEHWLLLEAKLKEILGTQDAAPAAAPIPRADKPVQDWTEEDIEAELAEYRQQLLEEREQAEKFSASPDSGSETA